MSEYSWPVNLTRWLLTLAWWTFMVGLGLAGYEFISGCLMAWTVIDWLVLS